jgi:hypothetical protein
VYWINNSAIMLEIIGFVLLLNALRRPIPPQTTDIRSNIAYSGCIKITTYSEEPSWIDLTGKASRDMVCLTIYDDIVIAGQCGKLWK